MIGLILTTNTPVKDLDQIISNTIVAVHNLIMLCDQILISSNTENYQRLADQFADFPTVTVVSNQTAFEQRDVLNDIFAGVCHNPTKNEYLLLDSYYCNIENRVLVNLASSQNRFVATPSSDFYTIAHFWTSKQELQDFLQLDDNQPKDFICDYQNCLPLAVPSSQIF
ncbi:hypothetical protein AYR62_00410 [Secundilactobacillus paracollinoides]|uniref:Uncharacterized protein n=1 Tax=Secundilactobacillus paracollinoides TaxID=240427 RepID=A0A1B2IVR3_9LACO|nr:hypothetical protein [Secundilactobacillus paracollinoides]ANZ60303.1 hypothetical protein AYR61_02345 [Secundilactobacillus paracollinoides]ANZ62712.1 hypothetical protein AYR62_00410 [Secundilactobacillus paracollinoides]ANZ66132.1 hypothetical protein AYR63_02545 [Secundilactobacillus paracollinoides]KRL75132.1 hypothetical protein FC17_GL003030 [Secundilactobacillus paracollinoides DSM 15502 = JCM 11969]